MDGPAVFDTNILIDLFNNRSEAADAIEQRGPHRAVSLVTWMEVMAGAKKYGQEARTAGVFSLFEVVDINKEIARRSVSLRATYGMKLPDAIILATAQARGSALITRNTKDFAGISGVITPYRF